MGKSGFIKKLVKGLLETAAWLAAAFIIFYHFYIFDTALSVGEAALQAVIILLIPLAARIIFSLIRGSRGRCLKTSSAEKSEECSGDLLFDGRHAKWQTGTAPYISEKALSSGAGSEHYGNKRVQGQGRTVSSRRKKISTCALAIAIVTAAAVSSGIIIHHSADSGQIPESLLEMKEHYPETSTFVNDYPKEGNVSHDMDISAEVKKGEIPLFLQWDKRWGYEQYGSDFLGITGCGPTCLSMVYSGLTGNTDRNPYQMAKYSEENGYYVDGEGTSWNLMTEGAEKLGLHSQNTEISAENIRTALSSGMPVICSMYPGDFTTSGHFIVLAGLDKDGNVIVRDPNSRINSEKVWSISRLLPQIHAMWEYSVS